MKPHLEPIPRAWGTLSLLACVVAAVAALLLSLWLCADMIQRGSFEYEGKPIWIAAVLIAVLGLAAAFIAGRLFQARPSVHVGLVLPPWFLMGFGVFMLVLSCAVTYLQIDLRSTVAGVVFASASVALILVSGRLRK